MSFTIFICSDNCMCCCIICLRCGAPLRSLWAICIYYCCCIYTSYISSISRDPREKLSKCSLRSKCEITPARRCAREQTVYTSSLDVSPLDTSQISDFIALMQLKLHFLLHFSYISLSLERASERIAIRN